MDCSSFGFYHCDLGPGNIIVNDRIGILDWETAGTSGPPPKQFNSHHEVNDLWLSNRSMSVLDHFLVPPFMLVL